MYLVQILLPLYDNRGKRVPHRTFSGIAQHLTDRFGGLTAYSRAPAEGLWAKAGAVLKDDIVVFEVMTRRLEIRWWRQFKSKLEKELGQESLIIRAQSARMI
jgi:hypothetical protein